MEPAIKKIVESSQRQFTNNNQIHGWHVSQTFTGSMTDPIEFPIECLPLFTGAGGDVVVCPYGSRPHTETAWIEHMAALICESIWGVAICKHQLYAHNIARTSKPIPNVFTSSDGMTSTAFNKLCSPLSA
jgi:hypothetical protein